LTREESWPPGKNCARSNSRAKEGKELRSCSEFKKIKSKGGRSNRGYEFAARKRVCEERSATPPAKGKPDNLTKQPSGALKLGSNPRARYQPRLGGSRRAALTGVEKSCVTQEKARLSTRGENTGNIKKKNSRGQITGKEGLGMKERTT